MDAPPVEGCLALLSELVVEERSRTSLTTTMTLGGPASRRISGSAGTRETDVVTTRRLQRHQSKQYRLGVRSLPRSSVGRSYDAGGQLPFGDVSRHLVQSAVVILGVSAEEAEGFIHFDIEPLG